MSKKWLLATAVAAALMATVGGVQAQGKTLKWGAGREIASLDPYSFGETFTLSVLNHVYEGLVRYTGDLKIEPALAESWQNVSPTVWRFKLRRGVKFHNGNPFTADDVIASLDRVTHPTSPLKGNLPAYKSSKKVDDFTVDIEMDAPYPLLLNDLTNIFIFDKTFVFILPLTCRITMLYLCCLDLHLCYKNVSYLQMLQKTNETYCVFHSCHELTQICSKM